MRKKEQYLADWAEQTTCHGVSDLFHARTWLAKLIWLFVLLACLCCLLFELFRLVDNYSQRIWTTSITEHDQKSLPLPSVTFCNYNRLKLSAVRKYNLSNEALRFLYGTMVDADYVIKQDGHNDSLHRESYDRWHTRNGMDFLTVFERLGYQCTDLFLDDICYGNDPSLSVAPVYTSEFNRCFRVDVNRNSTKPGAFGGLSFLLNVQTWEYIPLAYNNYADEGIAIQIAYDGKVELGEWTSLTPGTHTSIVMHSRKDTIRLYRRQLLNPFKVFDSTPPCALEMESKFMNGSSYSKMSCEYECKLAVAVKRCNCLPYLSSQVYRTCQPLEVVRCFAFGDKSEQEGVVKCKEECRAPCYHQSIKTYMSFTTFPARGQIHELEKYVNLTNMTREKLRDNIIRLEMYYDTLAIKIVEKYEALTLDMLISNTGGLLSLWTGMSFITIFQAMTFMVKAILRKLLPRSNQKATDSAPV